jgi:uncharacterized protein
MTQDDDIAAFDRVCARLAGFSDRISTEWADGYLSALLSGPRALLLTEWLPAMSGDAFGRAFADPDDVRQASDALLRRWSAIGRELDPERLLDDDAVLWLRPVLFEPEAEDDEIEPAGMRWAEGFLAAVHDFAADWQLPASATEDAKADHASALKRIAALTFDPPALEEHLREQYQGQTLAREDLVDEACYAVQDLRIWWVDHAPKPATRRVEATPGRNDPCPCGSGKKYKKCHGA